MKKKKVTRRRRANMDCNNSVINNRRNCTYDAVDFFNDLTKEYNCNRFKENDYLLFSYNSPKISTITIPVETYSWNNSVITIGSDDIILRLKVDNCIAKCDECLEIERNNSYYTKYTIFFQDGDLSIFIKNRKSC